MSNRKMFIKEDIDRVEKFLNRENVYRQLKAMLSLLIPNRSDVKLELNIGGESYTDGKNIVVGLPQIFLKSSFEEIFTALLALVGHESQHINSSNFQQLKRYIESVVEKITAKYPTLNNKVSKYYLVKVVHAIANSVEDGRIEKILGGRFRGFIKYLQLLNGREWKNSEIGGTSELMDLLHCIVSYAVTGLNPRGYSKVYKGSELDHYYQKIKPLILKGIDAKSCYDCLEICKKIVSEIEPYLIKLIEGMTEETKEMLEKLKDLDSPEYTTSDEVDYNTHPFEISVHFKVPKENEDEEGKNSKEKKEQKGKSNNSEDEKDENKDEGKDSSSLGIGKSKKQKEEEEMNVTDASGEGNSSSNKDSKSSEGDSKKDKSDEKESTSEKEKEDSTSKDGDSTKDGDSSEKEEKSDLSSDSNGSSDEYDDMDISVMDQIIDELRETVKDEIKEKIREKKEIKDKKKKQKENLNILDGEDISEIENVYKNKHDSYAVVFKEIRGFPMDYDLPENIKREGKRFRKEIENIFRNKEAYSLHGQRKGILDQNHLWKISIKDPNVFVKKGVPVQSDYVIYLLQDGSGSMHWEKKEYESMRAVAIMEEALKGIVPFKISTFSVDYSGINTLHYCVKEFNQHSNRNFAYNFFEYRKASGGNKDGFNIRIATKELLKRPEKDKVLIVFSDGIPTDYSGGIPQGMVDVKEAVKEARKHGIYVVSIIFGNEEFRKENIENYKFMYQKNIISCDPRNITNQLSSLLRKILIR